MLFLACFQRCSCGEVSRGVRSTLSCAGLSGKSTLGHVAVASLAAHSAWLSCSRVADDAGLMRVGAASLVRNHEKREVFVIEEIIDLLGSWWGQCGKPADDKLVLPGETKTGYLNPQ